MKNLLIIVPFIILIVGALGTDVYTYRSRIDDAYFISEKSNLNGSYVVSLADRRYIDLFGYNIHTSYVFEDYFPVNWEFFNKVNTGTLVSKIVNFDHHRDGGPMFYLFIEKL